MYKGEFVLVHLGLYEFALFFARRLPRKGRPKLGSPMGELAARKG